MGTAARLIIGTIIGLVVLYVLGTVIGGIVGAKLIWGTIDYVVDNIAGRAGISTFLVRAVVIILTIPFFRAVAKFTGGLYGLATMGWANPLDFYSKASGLLILAYASAFFVAMYYASIDAYAYKFCATTPEGIWTADGPGKDPVYGIELAPCSVAEVKTLRNTGGKLRTPQELHVTDAETYTWFNPVTGLPAVWFSVSASGQYRFFDQPGGDPASGRPLLPITADVVERYRQLQSTVSEKTKLESLLRKSQEQFDAGNYREAKNSCEEILKKDPGMESAQTIHQRACVKLAQDLVKNGQVQGEKGQFDEALWSAREALKLDATNTNAAKLEQFALQMKPHSLN